MVRDAVWCEPRGFFSEFIIKKVRAAVGCELLRVRAALVVTLKNRVRAAAVGRRAVWGDLRIFFCELIKKKVRAAVGASCCGCEPRGS